MDRGLAFGVPGRGSPKFPLLQVILQEVDQLNQRHLQRAPSDGCQPTRPWETLTENNMFLDVRKRGAGLLSVLRVGFTAEGGHATAAAMQSGGQSGEAVCFLCVYLESRKHGGSRDAPTRLVHPASRLTWFLRGKCYLPGDSLASVHVLAAPKRA